MAEDGSRVPPIPERRHPDWREHLRLDPRSTAELLREAPFDGRAATILMARADREVLEGACELCRSPVPHEREAGAHILGQLGLGDRAFPDETVEELTRLLREESTLAVISTALIALGHRYHPAAVAAALPFTFHRSEEIRYAAVFALLTQEAPEAVAALIRLSEDEDEDVRNWATFGLGSQLDLDTPEIRQALRARLEEPDGEIRGEALVGLARRGDRSVLTALRRELSLNSISHLALEAAAELADPALLPELEKIATWWDGDKTPLEMALEQCRRTPNDGS